MKRTLATLGVVGLGLISLTAPAIAASDPVVITHSGGSALIPLVNVNGTGGNGNGGTNNGGANNTGGNGNGGTNNGGANNTGGSGNNAGGNGGGGTDNTGGGTGGGGTDNTGGGTNVSAALTPAAAPKAAPQAAPAAAPVSVGTNQGYNAQTAVGAESTPGWLAGLGALAAAGAMVGVRRRPRPLHTTR